MIPPVTRQEVAVDCAARAVRWLGDSLSEDELAGLWMQIVHDGDTDVSEDWRVAYAEVRAAREPPPPASTLTERTKRRRERIFREWRRDTEDRVSDR